jgi:predicted Na+-dependent transporter
MKIWVEKNANWLLIAALIVPLFLPTPPYVPDSAILLILAGMIYFSCSQMKKEDLLRLDIKKSLLFYILRFLALPFVLYGLTALVLPDFKESVLLLTLAPAGASSTSMTGMFGGNVTATMGYVVISSMLAPFTIPAGFALAQGTELQIDYGALMLTLMAVIFIPAGLYFGAIRNVPSMRTWTQKNSRFGVSCLIILMTFVLIGRQKETILADPLFLATALPLLLVLYAIYYAFGWFFPASGPDSGDLRQRITRTVSSGANNNGLVIGLAGTYFSPEIGLFMVLSEVGWVLGLALFESFLKRVRKRA